MLDRYILQKNYNENLQDSCTIRVRIRDENDNPPVLLSKHREIVLRDAEEGTVVATLKVRHNSMTALTIKNCYVMFLDSAKKKC